MELLLCCLLAQVTFDWQPEVRLNVPGTASLERITITRDHIVIRDENAQAVHILDKSGKLKTELGTGIGPKITVPFQVTWMPKTQRYFVYDAGPRNVTIWDESGNHQELRETGFDYFFELGRLHPVKGGYIAAISLTEGKYLVGKYDSQFKPIKYTYNLMDKSLAEMSSALRTTYVTKVTSNQGPLILAIQKLSKEVAIYNADLEYVRLQTIDTNGWKPAKMKRLEKVSQNPKALARYRSYYSDIAGMEGLHGSVFIIGVRNLKDPDTYTYGCYDAANGLPVTTSFDSPYVLVGSFEDELYFANPNEERKALYPCKVRH